MPSREAAHRCSSASQCAHVCQVNACLGTYMWRPESALAHSFMALHCFIFVVCFYVLFVFEASFHHVGPDWPETQSVEEARLKSQICLPLPHLGGDERCVPVYHYTWCALFLSLSLSLPLSSLFLSLSQCMCVHSRVQEKEIERKSIEPRTFHFLLD